ncbi:MAG: hypothetical protein H6557_02580 [Lewinellaceae bacterium]|nr:hypothetical protein [Lewinellaceae bacterium]
MFRFPYNIQYILYLALLLACRPAGASSGKYPIRNFTPSEYKAGIQNIDFAQNRGMSIFVANNLGVLSFDGNEWKQYDLKTGKKKRSLAFDENTNRLYAGSQGEFGFYEGNWKYVSLLDKIPSGFRDFDEVWDVFLADSKVYFCTFQGIYVYDGQSIAVIEQEGGLERSFLANGKVFTQSQQGQLLEIDGLKLAHTYPQGQAGAVIAGLIPQDEGYLLIYNSGQIEWTTPLGVSRKYDALSRALQGTYVNHILQLSDTRLVIATQTAGLFLYDLQEEALEQITRADGLGSNACLRSFQDYYGNLWVGMQNGIALIHIHSPMRFLNREIGIQGSGYEVFETEAGTYFTTSNGIYFLGRNADRSVFLPGTEGPAYGMQEIAGKLYAGHHTGLFLLEGAQARYIANTDGLWQVKQLQLQPEFAIGGTYSGLYLFRIDDNQQLHAVHKIKGFNASSRFFEEDQRGNIWVGQYYKGLYQLTLSDDMARVTVKNASREFDLPIKEQIVLSRVDDGLYLATNSGLYQLDPANGSARKADIFSGPIGEQSVYLLAKDQRNNVHLIADNVVALFRQISAKNYQFIPSSLYQLRYYLNNDLLHISIHTSHGVFFSANEGFIHYDPALEIPPKVKKPLLVSQVLSVTEGRALYARQPFEAKPKTIGPLEFGPGTRVLKIDVESFQFNSLGNQQFRYFLKGLDEDFGDWTTAATKEYTNLKEGDYEFRVQTRNYLGEITTGQTLYLTVTPPFYRSPFAQFLYVLIAGAALFMGFRFQKRRYKRKTAQMEEASQLQLAKEQQKLAEVEQLKEQELLRLKEEKMQSELQQVNNLLAASTMNLVVKNEFIEAIKEELKELKQRGENPKTKRALEKIVKEIDIALRLQEDWEQFEYHFDQVHGDFLNRLRNDYPDLSPKEQKLCTFLRLNLNTKEIANLLSISLRGVEVARYRLRKKLRLEKGENLSKFILDY